MAKIGDLISHIKVGSKRYDKPEWWATQHKIKKEIKKDILCKANASFNYSYRVNSKDSFSSVSDAIDSMHLSFDSKKHPDLAPWNPIFRPYKQLIVFKKNK